MVLWEKVNNTEWKVYVEEEMLNWVDPLDKEVESEVDNLCYVEHFPESIFNNQLQQKWRVI